MIQQEWANHSPSYAQHGASISKPASTSAGETKDNLNRRLVMCINRCEYRRQSTHNVMGIVCLVQRHVTSHGTESHTALYICLILALACEMSS